jgi:large subunit ribosomal protein L2
MNPVDHPHGGGEGKKSKKSSPRSSWGKMFKWVKTGRKIKYLN